jgi:hypothetical protein
MSDNIFEKGLKVNISKHVEKKGRFNYLSWTFAVCELRKLDSKAIWEVKHFSDDSIPYMKTDAGYFVEVTVSLSDGTSFAQIHPVLDNSNKPLVKPDAFQINTSIQRCLVKAIALASGIGLSLYAGEDLPTDDKEEKKQEHVETEADKKEDDNLKSFLDKVEDGRKVIGEDNYKKALDEYNTDSADKIDSKQRQNFITFMRTFKGV